MIWAAAAKRAWGEAAALLLRSLAVAVAAYMFLFGVLFSRKRKD